MSKPQVTETIDFTNETDYIVAYFLAKKGKCYRYPILPPLGQVNVYVSGAPEGRQVIDISDEQWEEDYATELKSDMYIVCEDCPQSFNIPWGIPQKNNGGVGINGIATFELAGELKKETLCKLMTSENLSQHLIQSRQCYYLKMVCLSGDIDGKANTKLKGLAIWLREQICGVLGSKESKTKLVGKAKAEMHDLITDILNKATNEGKKIGEGYFKFISTTVNLLRDDAESALADENTSAKEIAGEKADV